jgi:hypothetical protein
LIERVFFNFYTIDFKQEQTLPNGATTQQQQQPNLKTSGKRKYDDVEKEEGAPEAHLPPKKKWLKEQLNKKARLKAPAPAPAHAHAPATSRKRKLDDVEKDELKENLPPKKRYLTSNCFKYSQTSSITPPKSASVSIKSSSPTITYNSIPRKVCIDDEGAIIGMPIPPVIYYDSESEYESDSGESYDIGTPISKRRRRGRRDGEDEEQL